MNKPSIKILVGYYKPFHLFKSDFLIPMHGGRALKNEPTKDGKMQNLDWKWLINNCIGDDTGENWSNLNRYINEITPIYWAWKNYDKLGNPDYIGFMQYAKHLIFNPFMEISRSEWLPDCEAYTYTLEDYIKNNNLDKEHIEKALEGYDILCAEKIDVYKTSGSKNCRDRLDALSGGNVFVFDKMLEIIRKDFPTYIKQSNEIRKGCQHYPLNIFVMKKEVFFKYCEFVMGVEQKLLHECKAQFESASMTKKRVFGFISEFLTSMFISKMEDKYRIKKLKVAVINVPSVSIPAPKIVLTKKLYLLGLKLFKLKRSPQKTVLFALGVQVYTHKIKEKEEIYSILYIPILKIKTKRNQ